MSMLLMHIDGAIRGLFLTFMRVFKVSALSTAKVFKAERAVLC
jgi:hypothetical protein